MRFYTLAACALAATFLFSSGAQAAPVRITDPAAFVRSAYALIAGNKPVPDGIYSDRLQKLFALDGKEAHGEVGRMDFDIFMNGQDALISGLKITAAPVENAPDRQVVIAKFRNGNTAEEVHFYFEKTNGNWRLDEARGLSGEPWTLSTILKYGWDGKS